MFMLNPEHDKSSYVLLPDENRNKYDIEDIKEKHGERYLYVLYEVATYEISRNASMLLIYATLNKNLAIDAYVEKYYLITLDKSNNPISSLEIAVYEADWGSELFKFCEINEDLDIEIRIRKLTEDLDTGQNTEEEYFESYTIDQKGIIQKRL